MKGKHHERHLLLNRLLRLDTRTNLLVAKLQEAYSNAVEDAADETGLPIQTFPDICLWFYETFMDKEFWLV